MRMNSSQMDQVLTKCADIMIPTKIKISKFMLLSQVMQKAWPLQKLSTLMNIMYLHTHG